MNTNFTSGIFEKLSEPPLSPRTPRNKIERKPDNLKRRLLEEKHRRQKSKGY